MDRRGRRLTEHVRLMKRLWTEDVVEHDGEFYRLLPVRQDPKPVQRPHPPVLLGGSAPGALQRAGELADGWVSASAFTIEQVRDAVAAVRAAAAAAERDPDALAFVCRGAVRVRPEPRTDRPYCGPVELVKEQIAEVAAAGATEFFVDLNFDPEIGSPTADAERSMDRARELLEAFAPAS
jgi:alkanesulfonate monooxygenase SsuD/methylene tetrahydromethanopterin reductase-like flavin-dependent oxidoreductase (luciferase family)